MAKNENNPWPALLKAWRKERKMTAAQASSTVGISLDSWRGWEYGTRVPSDTSLVLHAAVVHKSSGQTWSDNPFSHAARLEG